MDVGLVVFEEDVITGPILFDEVVFEYERFLLGIGDHEFEIARLLKQKLNVVTTIAAITHVVSNARAELLRLTHVDDLSRPVLEQVDAGTARKPPNGVLYVLID